MSTSMAFSSPHHGLAVRAVIVAARCSPLLYLCALFSGCVSLRVEPLTHESFPPRENLERLQVLKAEPAAAHIKLARIIATSDSADEDQMQEKILARAKTLGADAVVMGKFDILESMGAGPLYESTLGPTADNFGPYSGGWGWWPFYYDPWSFVQGASDQIGRTEYLSGIAIRFMKES
jgi:nucleotide-binding universal stress UspA family protein